MRPVSFRQKVLLLAVALVTVIQLVTLFPVLGVIKRDADGQASRSVRLAGIVFDEFMRNRTAQLQSSVDVVAADYGFKSVIAEGDPATVESNLVTLAQRTGAGAAVAFDLDGQVIARAGASPAGDGDATLQLTYDADPEKAYHSVRFIDGKPFQTVTVPVRAPVTVAWLMLGFPVDRALAADIESLTELEVSFVKIGVAKVDMFASTLPEAARTVAAADIHLGQAGERTGSLDGGNYLTALRPFLDEPAELYVALQLPIAQAMAPYRSIRSILLLITSASLLLAIGGAFWLAGNVTRPVQHLAAAARRMREGVYTQPLDVASTDELGELATGFNAMQQAIAERERHIVHIAHHDSLSGLPTRDLVVTELRDKMAASGQLTVVNLALHRFDGIVSSLGHRTADEVIKIVASALRGLIRQGQGLGHLNHQEFIFVLPSFSIEQTMGFVHTIMDTLRAGIVVQGANISLQARAGVARYPDHSTDPAELLRCAAIARNDAQHRHEPAVEYRLGQEDRAVQLVRIVGDFPRALENDELELDFQPQIDCNTREVVGAEALVRWCHPELGLLPPDKFIEAIEQAGGISHLTRWVLRKAVSMCASWRAGGLPISIAVNISADDLVDEHLPHFLLEIVTRSGLKPGDVTLEVTESAIMHDVEISLAVVSCMRELGFRVAIDDFGTGQSALAQLKRIPVDELKIDKSFVMNMDNRRDEAIVRASVELAHQFGLHVVAEGVESAQALERLQTLGCEFAQGYHISKPIPAAEFAAWARRWSSREGTDLVSMVTGERGRAGQAGS